MSWHTKYRPRAVSELHVTEVRELLLELMKSGTFPQVFLCAGPKGTGKTSTSRIIGAMLNDPANQAAVEQIFFGNAEGKTSLGKKNTSPTIELVEPNPDSELSLAIFAGESFVVQEMDAASNRGIDDVRQLKERVNMPPASATMAVYILDEVHMLTSEAFNALLKLLEEPPAHAVFVLATTELHKVPATIQSRCTILPFRKATAVELRAALQRVVDAEGLKIDDDALAALSQHADGSFRDAIKSLELVAARSAGKEIGLSSVTATLHTGFMELLPGLVSTVIAKDEQQLVKHIEHLRGLGVGAAVVYRALLDYLHQDLLKAVGVIPGTPACNQRVSHFLLQELMHLPTSSVEPIPLLALELKLLELIYRSKDRNNGNGTSNGSSNGSGGSTTIKANGSNGSHVASKAAAPTNKKEVMNSTQVQNVIVPPEAPHVQQPVIEALSSITQMDNILTLNHVDTKPLLQAWSDFVRAVEQRNSTLGAFLRSAKPLVEESNGVAKIEVYYKFHRDQLMQPRFIDLLQQCAEPMLGGKPGFEFVLGTHDEAIADTVLM
jgi:DNA polymerase III subunit gamma/tau